MRVDITVAVPTHNRRETVVLAVQSALQQSRPACQVIVIADGCTDGTVEAVRELDPSIEVLDLPKKPGWGYANRNVALERARGSVISWLQDDDLYLPDHLERIAEPFDAGIADLVQASFCEVYADGRLEVMGGDWGVQLHRTLLMEGETRSSSTSVSHQVESALAVGGWDGSIERRGDRELWSRIVASGARCVPVRGPTCLCLTAHERDQSWAARVAQNEEMGRLVADPHELARLHAEMEHARRRAAAEVEIGVAGLRQGWDDERAENERLRVLLSEGEAPG